MKKKHICFSITCMLFMATFTQAQESSLKSRLRAKLEVSTSISEQRMCSSGSEIKVFLTLSARFMNVGEYPIIIAKKSGSMSNPGVAHTEKEAYALKFEYKSRLIDFGHPDFIREQGEAPSELFVIIKPKGMYEHAIDTWLDFQSAENYQHYAETDHFIRFSMPTIDGILYSGVTPDGGLKMSEEDLRFRWIRHGYLWLDGVLSNPMRLRLPTAVNLSKC